VTSGGYEVDFVVGAPGERAATQLIQACADMKTTGTREREIRAVSEAMAELQLPTAVIVTLHDRERIEVPEGTIEVVPAWQWTLGL
jgi:hypothetical protein